MHGGGLDAAIRKFGGGPRNWLDLSTGINPFSYPVSEISGDCWQRLPGSGAENEVIEAARDYYSVPAEADIIIANGTQALIECLPLAFSSHVSAVLDPTYGEHAHVWEKRGNRVGRFSTLNDLPDDCSLATIVNPNNPDCRVFGRGEMLGIAATLANNNGILIVDEAFCDCMPEQSLVPELPENAIVLKSFGKFFGLAGMRLGFAVGHKAILEKLRLQIGPWSVSGPALAIGAQALGSADWVRSMRAKLLEESNLMAQTVRSAGLDVEGVNPLFIYIKHEKAIMLYEHLAQSHILVRYFPDRPTFLRFGLCRDGSERDRLRAALEQFKDG